MGYRTFYCINDPLLFRASHETKKRRFSFNLFLVLFGNHSLFALILRRVLEQTTARLFESLLHGQNAIYWTLETSLPKYTISLWPNLYRWVFYCFWFVKHKYKMLKGPINRRREFQQDIPGTNLHWASTQSKRPFSALIGTNQYWLYETAIYW